MIKDLVNTSKIVSYWQCFLGVITGHCPYTYFISRWKKYQSSVIKEYVNKSKIDSRVLSLALVNLLWCTYHSNVLTYFLFLFVAFSFFLQNPLAALPLLKWLRRLANSKWAHHPALCKWNSKALATSINSKSHFQLITEITFFSFYFHSTSNCFNYQYIESIMYVLTKISSNDSMTYWFSNWIITNESHRKFRQ